VPGTRSDQAHTALAAERQFVTTLGGFVLGIAGAELVTHERIPIPRFNFVQITGVGRGRQSLFFERALDHYFQRALRPTFRVPLPEPEHLVEGLRRFGFRPQVHPLVLLIADGDLLSPPAPGLEAREAAPDQLEEVLKLVSGTTGLAEFRSAVTVAWHSPNPGERLAPVVAVRAGQIVSAAIRYEQAGTVGLHFITTRSVDRGQGSASALVAGAFGAGSADRNAARYLLADSPRLEQRLRSLGFEPALSFREYSLPANAELAFPDPGPATPPRWRPPRGDASRPTP
jgi:hypothetical protein